MEKGINATIKRISSIALALVLLVGTVFTANFGNAVTADAATETATGNYDEWDGSRSTDFSKGSGTKDDPYIIETAEQLYGVVTSVGGKVIGTHKYSDTETYNIYEPYYYKVADSIDAFYLSGTGYSTLVAAEENPSGMKYWNTWRDDVANYRTDGFNGVLDGNGVTVYGMYNPYDYGFIGMLSSGVVSNFNFEACYMTGNYNPAIITTKQQLWHNSYSEVDLVNISVRNCHIRRNYVLDNANASAAGLVAVKITPTYFGLTDCYFDATSCTYVYAPTSTGSKTNDTSITGGAMLSADANMNVGNYTNCVSIGAPIAEERVISGTAKYTNYANYPKIQFTDCYTDEALPNEYSSVTKLSGINRTDASTINTFNWKNLWEMVDSKPALKAGSVSDTAYSKQIAEQRNGTVSTGANKRNERQGGYANGTYGMYETLNGSGTKDDPYLITNAFELARAIASGGKKITERLYYKLANDIDAANAPWVNTTGIDDKYAYVAFEGELDGAGHTVYNLSATGEGTVGLIPELTATGVVKNLHIRNAYIASTNNGVAGAIAGTAARGAQIDGCSVEDVEIKGTSANAFFGENNGATVTTSYYFGTTDVYYNDKGETFTPAANDLITKDEQGKTWYKGYNGKVRLVNNAKAMTYADITGTGLNQEFGAADAPALMSHLLGKEGYENVYGDVTRNGEVNISDLAALARSQVSNYNRTTDGFWRAVENGEMVIYYAENDNYDAARALELYLEAESGKDIKKVVATGNATWGLNDDEATRKSKVYAHVGDIVISGENYYEIIENAKGKITTKDVTADAAKYALDGQKQILVGAVSDNTDLTDTNAYKINYTAKDAAVAFQGGSFTGIMQAVNEFITKSNHDTAKVCDAADNGVTKTLAGTAYEAITVGDSATPNYFYVWGDEFNTEGTTNLTENNWTISQFGGATASTTYYAQMENAFAKDMSELYEVTGGKLRIWRGYYGKWDGDYTWNTDKTQGYKNLKAIDNVINKTNEFGATINENENYVSAGLIATSESVLAKRGYLEMKATLPSDGNTFASWWLMGFNGQNSNTSMSNSLYGKVFKLNNAAAYASGLSSNLAWNGSDTVDSSNPATFKYILPQSTFEIDIAEFIQATGRKGTKPNWWSGYQGAYQPYAQYNFHKYYRTGVYGTIAADGTDNRKIKFIDWTNTLSTGAAKYLTVISPDTFSYGQKFSTTADEPGLISTVNGDGSPNLSDDNRMETDSSNKYNSFDGTVANKELIYTAEWTDTAIKFQILSADGSRTLLWDNSVDFSNAGGFQYKEISEGSNDEKAFFSSLANDIESDKDAMNQYMYMLIDNIYYTMNTKDGLLYQGESTNRTVMEVDYVRIYQQDGKRDVVTPNTQAFNNGNHFGY